MKKFYLLVVVVLAFVGCAKESGTKSPADKDANVVDMRIPASFDWKTTAMVACDFSAAHASKVAVSTEPMGEPFATFMVGEGVDPISLTLPASTQTLYVSYQTETGMTRAEAIPVSSGRAAYAVKESAKDYTGLEDGDYNSTEGNVIYMPAAKQGWGTLMFEDLWPAYGDYDFNDMVVNYKVQLYMNNKNKVNAMLISARVRAVGGSIPYDFCLAMTGVKGGEIDGIERYESGFANAADNVELEALNSANNVKDPAVLRFNNLRSSAGKPAGAKYLNTERGFEMVDADLVQVAYLVEFRNSIALADVAFNTFDFFLMNDENKEIHMGGYAPTPAGMDAYTADIANSSNIKEGMRYYYSKDNLVWALNIPEDVSHAYETEDFLKAYPEFKTWAESGGVASKDWYQHGVSGNLVQKR